MRYLSFIFFFIPLVYCTDFVFARNIAIFSDTSRSNCFQNAEQQLDESLSLMKKHYYKKDAVNWDSITKAAKLRLFQSASCEDAYETVNWCFRLLNETHSFIMPPNTAAIYNYDTAALKQKPLISQLIGELKTKLFRDKGIAYLSLPWIRTSEPQICTRIADSIQGLIATLDEKGVSKWIIDLRQNKGGNCWPMLAGIGPLLGEGICGYFVTGEEKVPISYRNGAAMHGRYIRCQVSKSPYQPKHEKKWIIILTGPHTSSSGEIVALAFKGKDQVYMYGEPTAGFTTANTTYKLTDNSVLVLTICMEADRNGKIYEGQIFPDEIVSSSVNSADDNAMSAAIMFLDICD